MKGPILPEVAAEAAPRAGDGGVEQPEHDDQHKVVRERAEHDGRHRQREHQLEGDVRRPRGAAAREGRARIGAGEEVEVVGEGGGQQQQDQRR